VRHALAAIALALFAGVLNAQTFEVASVRPSDPNSRAFRFEATADNGLRAIGTTLHFLIRMAYDVEDFQLSGGAAWTRSERFDISATPADPNATDLDASSTGFEERTERLRQRLHTLLAERFQLILRQESRDAPVYILEQMKNGNKLSPPTGDRGIGRNRGLISAENASVPMFAKTLSVALLRPVIDHTGLTGNYAFKLEWAEEGAPGEPEDTGVSLFTAIQEQLGLRLQSGKAPVPFISIDRAEKPSSN